MLLLYCSALKISFLNCRCIHQDYFGYNVFYVMNVTDVDDKIIIRARREYLLAQYIDSATDVNQVSFSFGTEMTW